jgi:hypothetical protein
MYKENREMKAAETGQVPGHDWAGGESGAGATTRGEQRARKQARRLARQEAQFRLSDIGTRALRRQPGVVVEAQAADTGRARRVHPLERMLNRGAISRAQHDAGMAVCNRAAAVELAGGAAAAWLGERVDGGNSGDDGRAVRMLQATRRYLVLMAPLDARPGSAGLPGLSQRELVRQVAVQRACVADLAGPSARARVRLAEMLRACLDAVREQITNNA